MICEGYKIVTRSEVETQLARQDKTATLQDVINTQFEIKKSYYYAFHNLETKEKKIKIVYQVETKFSES